MQGSPPNRHHLELTRGVWKESKQFSSRCRAVLQGSSRVNVLDRLLLGRDAMELGLCARFLVHPERFKGPWMGIA
ncbi:MAG: hypothetical protein EBU26_15225, partial [Verrucomicrobia bacterium]|nr:hypothetical protein [Verrucomicrobiota bacterium]